MHVKVHRIGQVYEADLKFVAICVKHASSTCPQICDTLIIQITAYENNQME
jgi:hypothetical protein